MASITLTARKDISDCARRLFLGKFSVAITGAAMAGALIGHSSACSAETLAEALAMAYQNNPTLQAQRAALRATDEAMPQARAGWRPNLDILGDGGYAYQNPDSGPTDDGGTYSASLRLTQNLYAGGGTLADVRRARNIVRAGQARLTITEQDVLSQAVAAYTDVVRDIAVLRLNINNEKVLRRQQEATKDRFNVGEVTRTDVAQAEARSARARADRILAQGNLKISKGIYKQIIGKAPGGLINRRAFSDLPDSRARSLEWADENNPGVVAARYDERAARDGVDVVESELFPKVDVIGEGGRRDEFLQDAPAMNEARVTAQLTIPLYQRASSAAGFARRSRSSAVNV